MSHHLQLSGKPVRTDTRITTALTLTAAFLASCNTIEQPILTPPGNPSESPPQTMVKLKTLLFITPDGLMPPVNAEQEPEVQVFSAEEGAKIVKRLQRNRKVNLLPESGQTLTLQDGRSGSFGLRRDFIYPTEYKPAEFPDPVPEGPNFPVTPATPTKFETRSIGIKATCKVHSLKPDEVDLGMTFNRDMFIGFINYGTPITTTATSSTGKPVEVVLTENRIEMPVFDHKKALTRLKVRPGDYIMIRGLNSTRSFDNQPFTPNPAPNTPGGSAPLLAIIEVSP